MDIIVTTPGGSSAAGDNDRYTYVPTVSVTSISPTSGPAGGGTTVILSGSGFTGATEVSFGGTDASSYTVNSDTQITAVSQPEAAGMVDIVVSDPAGSSATGTGDQYTYVAPLSVTGVSPMSGPTAGGTTVTISGSGFTGATAVSFGGTAAPSYTVNSDSQITATSPAHAAGTTDVTVTTANGTSPSSSADQYTYVTAGPPAVTGVSPNSGPSTGGTSVTITGTGFTGASTVSFGTVPAPSFTVVSDTTITVSSPPAMPGTVDVKVTTPQGTSAANGADQFTYTSGGFAPLLALLPEAGTAGPAATATVVAVSVPAWPAGLDAPLAAAVVTASTASAPMGLAPAPAPLPVPTLPFVPAGPPEEWFPMVSDAAAADPNLLDQLWADLDAPSPDVLAAVPEGELP